MSMSPTGSCNLHPIAPNPCPTPAAAEFHGVKRDLNRHSIPRWRLYRPILEAIVEVERDKQKYVAKSYESVVFQV